MDLASLAYQIWKNACDADPTLKKTIPDLPNVVFSTKALSAVPPKPAGAAGPQPASGVMVYVRTADGNDALAWVDEEGRTVTESQHEILRAAACEPDTPTLPRLSNHHPLVQKAVAGIQTEQITTGGQLGKPSSARRRVYERLKDYAAQVKDTLFGEGVGRPGCRPQLEVPIWYFKLVHSSSSSREHEVVWESSTFRLTARFRRSGPPHRRAERDHRSA